MNIGNRIKKFRLHLNMNQIDLAKAIDVRQSSISGWESGKVFPDAKNIVELSKLGISPEWLLLGEGEMIKLENKKSPQYDVSDYTEVSLIIEDVERQVGKITHKNKLKIEKLIVTLCESKFFE